MPEPRTLSAVGDVPPPASAVPERRRPGLDGRVVAVTGGGGFIGARLLRALHRAGASVRALVGPPGAAGVVPPPGIAAWHGEIDDPSVLAPLVRDATVVLHLAGPRSVAASFGAAAAYARIHAAGTAAVADACAAAGVARLVYVSSAEVYGQPDRNPVGEEAPLAPRSPYAAAKAGGEAFVRAGAAAGGFEAVIARPFSVYGPGMAPDTLLGALVRRVRSGAPVEVFDPRPVRDYCHVDDVVTALVASCTAALPEPTRIYNLASGVGLPVAELARRVLALAGRTDAPRLAPTADRPRGADILALVGDPARAASELGWGATMTLEGGLAAMLRGGP
ncbi:NAD(P)-dependent oxidoreductase [Methylobacterium currus]|uniref:NAD(P)-dependent oxidoreductase n=1 Tax=Methylobacterium currus TaxID=2051553 RepID=A0A2R4WMS5_9HYPH|nr:NAD-dependent epimerase/dehydratase family protein [Methylobacterium currus]AWB22805.1 NAD(P)-dependent oxidoreductase [Methylobacterium currus]